MVRGKGNDDNDNNLGDCENDTNLVRWIEYRIEHDKIIIIHVCSFSIANKYDWEHYQSHNRSLVTRVWYDYMVI